MFVERLSRLSQSIQAAGLEALVLNPGPSMVYLTGLHFHLSERPYVMIFCPGQEPVLILPGLELVKAHTSPIKFKLFSFGDNPATWAGVFKQACASLGLGHAKVGVEPNQLRFLELRLLEGGAPAAIFESAAGILASLRMAKDTHEIASMSKAVGVAQRALQALLPSIRVGVTELELASELTVHLLKAGGDSGLPFAPIVAGGPNSANPHAVPTDRPLAPGDLLVIDWGASVEGYFSDLTRTFAIGQVDPELANLAKVVLEANAAGRGAGKPGLPAGMVDHAARGVIEKAGYGPYFTHRVGHGLGMEGHEEPYMFGENEMLLAAGMTYTVEPGIYLPGRGGVRIEDDVVVTTNGSRSLSDYPRELTVL
jgi:Xaa-Pro dipeptidase